MPDRIITSMIDSEPTLKQIFNEIDAGSLEMEVYSRNPTYDGIERTSIVRLNRPHLGTVSFTGRNLADTIKRAYRALQ
jgi:hypothetical protein